MEHPDYYNPPLQWFVCEHCDGSGVQGRTVSVYDPGCAWPRPDTEEWPCSTCGGEGGWLADAEPDPPGYDPTTQPYDEPFSHEPR